MSMIKRVIESEIFIFHVDFTLNSILVPAIIATPAKPILYNACKENRHGKDFCNLVAFVKYIYYKRKGMQKIQRGMWHGFEVPT